MFLRRLPPDERGLPFDIWLSRHIDIKKNRELAAFFERISRFALSLELSQVTTGEVIQTTKNMFRYGAPGIVAGGCAALSSELERWLLEQGTALYLHHDVLHVFAEDDVVTGVRVR